MTPYVNMLVPETCQKKIKQTINAMETGSLSGDYANISIYNDGDNKTRQITYGAKQTTEQGNLKTLVKRYCEAGGKYTTQLTPYLPKIGVKPLVDDANFINLLKQAGSDPVMIVTQDKFFDDVYFLPACKFFEEGKFTQALSLLIIFDSYVHSGGILPKLRNKFADKVPASGGDEKWWITKYIIARDLWLENNPDALLRKTDYRTDTYLEQILADNWTLEKPFIANGVTIK